MGMDVCNVRTALPLHGGILLQWCDQGSYLNQRRLWDPLQSASISPCLWSGRGDALSSSCTNESLAVRVLVVAWKPPSLEGRGLVCYCRRGYSTTPFLNGRGSFYHFRSKPRPLNKMVGYRESCFFLIPKCLLVRVGLSVSPFLSSSGPRQVAGGASHVTGGGTPPLL